MKKVCTFVINKENKILLLLGADKDPQFHRLFWYAVTGGCEDYDETIEDTVKREVKEETGLDLKESIYLNWIFKYESLGVECEEYVYVSFVDERRNSFK